MAKLSQQVRLPDGRILSYDEHGPPGGKPVIYIHGSPSARLEFNIFGTEQELYALNARLIAFDRPGMGLSDYQPGRRFLDLPGDVRALANHLDLDRFVVLAYSGGGPYAAACAFAIPDSLTRVGIVSGAAPFDQPGLADGISPNSRQFMDLAHTKPWLSRLMIRMMVLMCRRFPDKIIASALASLPLPDQEVIHDPAVQAWFLAMVQEAGRRGPRGAQLDTRLMVSGWDFRPQEIEIPVYLWHGEMDQNAPVAMGRYMAQAIPRSIAAFYPGEGHLSLFKKHFAEIIQTLLAEESPPSPRLDAADAIRL